MWQLVQAALFGWEQAPVKTDKSEDNVDVEVNTAGIGELGVDVVESTSC